MQRWFFIKSDLPAHKFLYTHELANHVGCYADQIPDFVDQLVELILGYATCDNPDIDRQFNSRYRIPGASVKALNRQGIEKLLMKDSDGYYRTLMGFTGECLAHWFYQSFA